MLQGFGSSLVRTTIAALLFSPPIICAGSIQCFAIWLQDCWRSPLPVSAPWTSYTGSTRVGIWPFTFPRIHSHALKCTHSSHLPECYSTEVVYWVYCLHHNSQHNQIQIKAVGLLRELLKQHSAAKLSRVAAALREAFTRSVEHTLTELGSPLPPTQERQEKEAGFTPSFKQA